MRQFRIGRAHGSHQRLHHFGLDTVREMPRVGNVLEAAPAVGNFLVLRQRIGDQREGTQIFLERLGQRFGGRFAFLAVGVLKQIERRLDRQRFAADLEPQAGDGLVERAVPGGIAGHRLLVEQLLDPILELVGLFLAHILDPRPVVAERRIGHRRVELFIVDAVELEREEQQMQRGGRDAFLHVAVELRTDRIGRIAGIEQRGIGDEPAEPVVDRLVALDRFGQCASGALARRQRGQIALEVAARRPRSRDRPVRGRDLICGLSRPG